MRICVQIVEADEFGNELAIKKIMGFIQRPEAPVCVVVYVLAKAKFSVDRWPQRRRPPVICTVLEKENIEH